MSEEQTEGREPEAPASSDSDAVQAALAGIPGLADAMHRPPARPEVDGQESDEEEPAAGFGAPRQVEDSETVQQALKQLGLQ